MYIRNIFNQKVDMICGDSCEITCVCAMDTIDFYNVIKLLHGFVSKSVFGNWICVEEYFEGF